MPLARLALLPSADAVPGQNRADFVGPVVSLYVLPFQGLFNREAERCC